MENNQQIEVPVAPFKDKVINAIGYIVAIGGIGNLITLNIPMGLLLLFIGNRIVKSVSKTIDAEEAARDAIEEAEDKIYKAKKKKVQESYKQIDKITWACIKDQRELTPEEIQVVENSYIPEEKLQEVRDSGYDRTKVSSANDFHNNYKLFIPEQWSKVKIDPEG